MALKIATPRLQERIRRASANIAAGVRLNKPELEETGRRESAKAHIENQILLGRHLLSSAECAELAKMLFDAEDDLNDEDYTADAVETNAEAEARQATRTAQPDADGDIEDLEPDEID